MGGRRFLGNAQSSRMALSIKANGTYIGSGNRQTDQPELPTSLQPELLSRLGF